MTSNGGDYVNVFPIDRTVFNLPADWFNRVIPMMRGPAFLLMAMLLTVSVGLMALKRFENANLEKKLWNLPVVVTAVVFWPVLVLGLKSLVDSFNTFLVVDVFHIPWRGFGFPEVDSVSSWMGWSGEALVHILPNLSYWLMYAFFSISFFFYSVLGPFILAKGILTDEIEAFIELLKELTLLFLWQTTLVILVAMLFPDVVSGQPFPVKPKANFYVLSLILGIMIFFVPSLTRKFGNHLGSSFIPMGFRYGGAALGLTVLGKGLGAMGSAVGFEVREAEALTLFRESVSKAEEFKARYSHKKHAQDTEAEAHGLRHELEHREHEAHKRKEKQEHAHEKRSGSKILELSKKAKHETK